MGLPLLSTLHLRLLTNTIHKAIHKNASVEEKDDYYRSLVMNQINIQKCHCGSLNGSGCRQLLRLVANGIVPSSFQKVVEHLFLVFTSFDAVVHSLFGTELLLDGKNPECIIRNFAAAWNKSLLSLPLKAHTICCHGI